LKIRLQKDYPQLVFHKPARKNESEIVYCSALSAENVVADSLVSSESTSNNDSEPENYDEVFLGESTCTSTLFDQHVVRSIFVAGR
jgi:membrane carboxypeptidase/penicillin-binding protein PbpC